MKLRKGGGSASITSDILRGHTETIILSLLLKQDSYGYKINKEILARTDRRYELKEATLYSAFKRLEQAGCIRTYWGDETTGAQAKILLDHRKRERNLRFQPKGLGGGKGADRPAAG